MIQLTCKEKRIIIQLGVVVWYLIWGFKMHLCCVERETKVINKTTKKEEKKCFKKRIYEGYTHARKQRKITKKLKKKNDIIFCFRGN